MDSAEFLRLRKLLDVTQKQLAELLGASLKAVHSYEQGWRSIPAHVERQLFFLLYSKLQGQGEGIEPCWVVKNCPDERREKCPAWTFNVGKICWFINGTICECKARKNWQEKMVVCRTCPMMKPLLDR